MDVVQGVELHVKLGPEPDESLVPAVSIPGRRLLGTPNRVISSPLPRRLPGPLGAG